jgi:hypothetical protein
LPRYLALLSLRSGRGFALPLFPHSAAKLLSDHPLLTRATLGRPDSTL